MREIERRERAELPVATERDKAEDVRKSWWLWRTEGKKTGILAVKKRT